MVHRLLKLSLVGTAVALAPSSRPDTSVNRRAAIADVATTCGGIIAAVTALAQPAEADDTYDAYLAAKALKDKKKDRTRLEYGSKTQDVNSIDLSAVDKLGSKAEAVKFGKSAQREKTIMPKEIKAERKIADDRKSLKELKAEPLVAPKIVGGEVGTAEYISAEDRKKMKREKVLSGQYAAELKAINKD